jgi:threonine dehydratase
MKEKSRYAGRRVGLVFSGGNIDMPMLEKVLRGETPTV